MKATILITKIEETKFKSLIALRSGLSYWTDHKNSNGYFCYSVRYKNIATLKYFLADMKKKNYEYSIPNILF